MTLTYLDGRAVEAVLLARTETTLRVVVQGADDVIELSDADSDEENCHSELMTINSFAERRRRIYSGAVDRHRSRETCAI